MATPSPFRIGGFGARTPGAAARTGLAALTASNRNNALGAPLFSTTAGDFWAPHFGGAGENAQAAPTAVEPPPPAPAAAPPASPAPAPASRFDGEGGVSAGAGDSAQNDPVAPMGNATGSLLGDAKGLYQGLRDNVPGPLTMIGNIYDALFGGASGGPVVGGYPSVEPGPATPGQTTGSTGRLDSRDGWGGTPAPELDPLSDGDFAGPTVADTPAATPADTPSAPSAPAESGGSYGGYSDGPAAPSGQIDNQGQGTAAGGDMYGGYGGESGGSYGGETGGYGGEASGEGSSGPSGPDNNGEGTQAGGDYAQGGRVDKLHPQIPGRQGLRSLGGYAQGGSVGGDGAEDNLRAFLEKMNREGPRPSGELPVIVKRGDGSIDPKATGGMNFNNWYDRLQEQGDRINPSAPPRSARGRSGTLPHYADGGEVDALAGPNPPGPDDGYAALDQGEFVVRNGPSQQYADILPQINAGTYQPGAPMAGGLDPAQAQQQAASLDPQQQQAVAGALSDPTVASALLQVLGAPFLPVMEMLASGGMSDMGGMPPDGMHTPTDEPLRGPPVPQRDAAPPGFPPGPPKRAGLSALAA